MGPLMDAQTANRWNAGLCLGRHISLKNSREIGSKTNGVFQIHPCAPPAGSRPWWRGLGAATRLADDAVRAKAYVRKLASAIPSVYLQSSGWQNVVSLRL
ncbi:hypothetical protein TWF102_011709 [Orbilia oligospora]|uniref:Uncharacterized protein n=1 Tax=Orbilia oligospora TaxID=2813651 RepID=A0A7C8NIX8_ORBOL|nr:hypothetical protein TWF102_011709 [Orbilia oligospora]